MTEEPESEAPLERQRERLVELIKVRRLCYRVRALMLWLLALGCWLVPWYLALPMVFCAALHVGAVWFDLRAHRQLRHELVELENRMAISSYGAYR